jgi:glycosyltransferase involved in cell wall biosynthesis
MEGRYHVALVTSAQPSANPRLVKEAKSLLHAGYLVSVIWCPISPWADEFDQELFNEFPTIKWIKAGYHAKAEPIGYWYARIRQKVWQFIYKNVGNYFDAAIKSHVLYSQELNSFALKKKADLYIGHNLGALPAIVKAAKKNKAKSIFDFEDFHRGEAAEGSLQTRMVKEIEFFYTPLVDSITTASSSITEAYQTIFKKKNFTTINNCFPLTFAVECIQTLPDRPLKLFWFSQYVGKQRGLQTVIKAMSNFSRDEIMLTLLGKATDEVKEYFYALMDEVGLNKSQVEFLDPVQESEIVRIASLHHIGLAAEYVHIANRDLCLTNKLFMYMLAGNALLMTDTKSQQYFFQENSNIGLLYKQENVTSLINELKNYLDNPNILEEHREKSFQLAKSKYNWEMEQNIFLDNVKSTFVS